MEIGKKERISKYHVQSLTAISMPQLEHSFTYLGPDQDYFRNLQRYQSSVSREQQVV